jgi:hemerythrin superfamily protein
MAQDDRDVIELLTHDHREVESMFDKLTAVIDPGERRQIADQITIELVRHSVAEEQYLYPACASTYRTATPSPTRSCPTMPRWSTC